MEKIDKVTEIKSDPMLLNFHFLPHEDQHQVLEQQSTKGDHVALQRTHSVSSQQQEQRNEHSNNELHENSQKGESKAQQRQRNRSLPNISIDYPELQRSGQQSIYASPPKNEMPSSFIHVDSEVENIFRKAEDNNVLNKGASVNVLSKSPKQTANKGRTYTVPLSNGNEQTSKSSRDKQRSKKISVQEMSLTYNSEDELLNQSVHSVSSFNYHSDGGTDSVRSHTPSFLENSFKVNNEGQQAIPSFKDGKYVNVKNQVSTSKASCEKLDVLNDDCCLTLSFDAEGDRVANSTGTDEDFIRMLDANSKKRKELEQKLNLLVEKTGTVLNNADNQ